MGAFAILAGAVVLAVAWTVFHARRAARGRKIDPKAIERTRMTGDGGGWLYDDNWPNRKKR